MKLHTTTVGDGPRRIALVHGLGADAETWHDFTERALATGRYTVIAVDLRGHGQSPQASSYTVDEFAGDLIASLPTGLDTIVSHSLGGAVVIRAIESLRPARAIYFDPGFKLALPEHGLSGWLVRHVPAVLPLFLLRGAKGVRAPALTPENRARLDAAHMRWDSSMALKVFSSVASTTRPVGAAAVPSVLVLSEDAPFVVPDPLPAELAAAGWDVRRIAGLSHSLFLEDPQRVFEAVQDVL